MARFELIDRDRVLGLIEVMSEDYLLWHFKISQIRGRTECDTLRLWMNPSRFCQTKEEHFLLERRKPHADLGFFAEFDSGVEFTPREALKELMTSYLLRHGDEEAFAAFNPKLGKEAVLPITVADKGMAMNYIDRINQSNTEEAVRGFEVKMELMKTPGRIHQHLILGE